MSLRRCIPVLTTTQAKECQSSKYYRTKEKTSLPIVVPTPLKSLNDIMVTALIPQVVCCCWSLSIVVSFTSWSSLMVVGHHGCGHIMIVVFGSGHCRCIVFMLWWSVVLMSMGGVLPSTKYTYRICWPPSVVVGHCPLWLALHQCHPLWWSGVMVMVMVVGSSLVFSSPVKSSFFPSKRGNWQPQLV